jgi:hypothetical protein
MVYFDAFPSIGRCLMSVTRYMDMLRGDIA